MGLKKQISDRESLKKVTAKLEHLQEMTGEVEKDDLFANILSDCNYEPPQSRLSLQNKKPLQGEIMQFSSDESDVEDNRYNVSRAHRKTII